MKISLAVLSMAVVMIFMGTPCFAEIDCTRVINITCTACHSKDQICAKLGQPESYWKSMITYMVANGAKISAEEQTTLILCLSNAEAACLSACGK